MKNIQGAGLGLRAEFLNQFAKLKQKPDWIEIVPENWIHTPYQYIKDFENIVQSMSVIAHGVSLSIGSLDDVDTKFLNELKNFLDRYNILHYSEHISFSSLNGMQTFELLPIPMTQNMVNHICTKIDKVQNILKRELILENASYYISPYSTMSETQFINEILQKSGAKLLLDVNNVFVNSKNHNFDAKEFINSLNIDQVAYMHIAGHLELKDEKILFDTHGEAITDEVWNLLKWTLKRIKVPVMIERDNNIPPLKELLKEYKKLKKLVLSPTN